MYSRNRGNWYQAAFWLIVGIFIGQFFRFNINFQPRESALPAQTQSENV